MDVIAPLELKLTDNEVAIQHFNHNTTELPKNNKNANNIKVCDLCSAKPYRKNVSREITIKYVNECPFFFSYSFFRIIMI